MMLMMLQVKAEKVKQGKRQGKNKILLLTGKDGDGKMCMRETPSTRE